ncbi:MAG: ATP-binding protein [Firmicutes bacterium]|nr:ATP-binding protein [Bacillota bacterium]
MGYRKDDYIKANGILDERRRAAEAGVDSRRAELHAAVPEILKIDRALSATESSIAEAIGRGPDGIRERIAEIEASNEALLAKRRELLKSNGYPEDYDEPEYTCGLCSDTGYVNGKMCVCKRRLLVLAGCEGSGMSVLMRTQSFESFSLDYYRGDARRKMTAILSEVKKYAEGFSDVGSGNILFVGGTGLGKTHLSTSAARVVIERGYDVKYVTVSNMISEFEDKKYHSGYGERSDDPTERYYECDLLIIDDLGAEVTTQFAVSCLYDVINARINTGRAMMISTNLSSAEIRKKYTDRIASRLFGEFAVYPFEGTDVRAEKLRAAGSAR